MEGWEGEGNSQIAAKAPAVNVVNFMIVREMVGKGKEKARSCYPVDT
jgi:hypothetical protein